MIIVIHVDARLNRIVIGLKLALHILPSLDESTRGLGGPSFFGKNARQVMAKVDQLMSRGEDSVAQ